MELRSAALTAVLSVGRKASSKAVKLEVLKEGSKERCSVAKRVLSKAAHWDSLRALYLVAQRGRWWETRWADTMVALTVDLTGQLMGKE